MQVNPASFTPPAFEPSAPGMDLFALPDAAEHTGEGERPPPYFAAPTPPRASVITPAVLQVLEWHRQHHPPR